MTISVVAQPTNAPPRFQITVTSPGGTAITAITLNRTQNGITTPVRVQPPAGPSPIVAYDYEAAWDTGVVYAATYTYASGSVAVDTASPVTLTSAFPWLIHPTTPGLSMILDQANFSAMGIVTLGGSTRAALTTKHRVLGAEFQIVTKVGPRAAPTLSMVIATVTAQERSGLIALLRDQTPLLIQFPASWGWDFDVGYFDVGDVGSERWLQYGPEHRRVVTLQLESVQAPAGTQQAIRTWTTLLAQFGSWQAVSAAYATWTDVLTDARR